MPLALLACTLTCSAVGLGPDDGADVGQTLNAAQDSNTKLWSISGSVSITDPNAWVAVRNGNDLLYVYGTNEFTLPTPYINNTPYHVTVAGSDPSLTCSITNNIGSVSNARISNVAVSCSARAAAPFANGFEVYDRAADWANNIDDSWGSGGAKNVYGYCCGMTGPQAMATEFESAHSGTGALVYSGTAVGNANDKRAYLKLFDLSTLGLFNGAYLSYWIFPQSQGSSFGGVVAGRQSAYSAVDVTVSNGTALHFLPGVVDQFDNSVAPASQGNLILDTWNFVLVDIGNISAEPLTNLSIGWSNGGSTGGYRGYLDDVIIDYAPPPSSTSTSTSWEAFQIQPSWVNSVDAGTSGGNVANVGGLCCGATGPQAYVSSESGHTGHHSLVYAGRGMGSVSTYAYTKILDLSHSNLVLTGLSTLTYWVYPQSQASFASVSGSLSTNVALDIIFADGSTLRSSDLLDSRGNGVTPTSQSSGLQLDTWNLVSVPLGKLAGLVPIRIDVGWSEPGALGGYRGLIDDINIADRSPKPSGTPPALVRIVLAPVPTILVGVGLQLKATAIYADGSQRALASRATYTSNAPTIATVDANGYVTTQAVGVAQITAALGAITSSPYYIRVTPALYQLGGVVSGLLVNTTVALTQAPDYITVGNGNYLFPTGVAVGSSYAAALASPLGQTCNFVGSSNAGVMPNSNHTSVLVTCTPNTYTLGGLISGLLSNTNVTLSDGNDTLAHTNGSYTFPTQLAYTQAYSIGLTNPNGQTCAFNPGSAGSGTMGAAPVTNANIACTTSAYPLGGSVNGLVTGNVTLTNTVNSDVISVGNGNYLFDQNVAYAGNYNVVATSPNGLTCAVTNGNAVMAVGGEFNVMVACTAKSHALGGTVVGLLANTNVTLHNGADTITPGNGNFTFPTGVAYNSNFAASLTQPTGQTCAFTSNSNAGVMPNSNDTNVLVTCTTNTYSLGGLISGLLSNTNVTLSDGNDTLGHTNGSYTFPTLLAYTQAYSIGLTNPNGQTCAFNPNSAGSGTMGAAPVTNANIVCTPSTYPLGGSVSGLVTGNVTLTNTTNSDAISIGNGNYLFDQNVAYAGNYNVVVTSPNGLTCAVTNGNAVMAVGGEFNVMVACTAKSYALGGTVVGLLANTNVTLHNGADSITPGNSNFTFPTSVVYNSNFAVSLTQPTGQTCAFTSNSNAGVMPNSNDTNVLVTCTTNTYSIGGLISGLLSNTNVTLSDGNDTLVHTNGSYTFPTLLAYTQAYSIGLTNPSGQTCAFNPNSAGSGTMGAAPVTNANIVCTTSTYPLGGSVSGLVTGNVTLTNTVNSDAISVSNGNYLFDQNVAYAGNYNVVATSPSGLTCAITNGNAVMAVGGEFNVMVACTAKSYALGGTVAGLLANTNVTLHNGADNITPGNGNFMFPTGVAYNSNFAASLTQPTGQTCAFTSNSNAGVMPNSNDTNVLVTCTTNTYTLGGLISGLLSNTNVTLSDGNNILAHTNGSYTFPTLLAYTQAYSIGLTNPNGQTCAFNPNSAGSGTMGAAPVTNANIVCTPSTYSLGGSVSGLVTGNVTLTNTTNSDAISVGNGNYLFDQNVAYAGNYNVVVTSPNGLTCAVTNGNAVMAVGGEFNVMVACTAKSYTLGGTVVGLLANTNVTLHNGADSITPGNSNFTFPTSVVYNSNFAASLTQPTGQTCAFTSNSNAGVMPNSNDTNVLVTCTANTYTLGGLISGLLSNTNVTLSDGNDILVHTNGSYTFPTLLAYTQAYSIGLTNPNGQTCAFNPNSAGNGTMGAAPVTNANIVCTTSTYRLGGSVSGLVTGNVTLTNTVNSDVISVGNGNYLFDQNVAYAGNYNVVTTSPNGLTCAVTNGNAVMAVGGEFNVMVACTAKTYTLGGTVAGLLANTNVTLHNGADNITPGNGNFTFPTGVAYNSNFLASLTQPTGQTCAFTSNSNAGVMPNSNDTNVLVTCTTNTYTLGGLISGLLSNTNVTLSDGNDTLVHTNGSYNFPTLLAYTQAYSIGLTNPYGQTCAFNPNSAGSGTMGAAPVTNANIVCTTITYPLGGSVSGLLTGNVTLTNTVNSDVISVGNGNYLFDQNVAYAGNYNVVAASPNGLTCAVTNGNTVMAVGGEFNVMVACTAKSYALGGTVVGLLANANVTLHNGADTITPGNGNFTFPTGVAYNSNFSVSLTQPTGQICAFTSNSNAGVMPAQNDANVIVSCSPNSFWLGGVVTGLLANTNVSLLNGNDTILSANGNFTFPTPVAYDSNFSVSLANPNGQVCIFTGNSNVGVMPPSNDTNVLVSCSHNATYLTVNYNNTIAATQGNALITAMNASGTVTDYVGTVHITSSDGNATLTPNYTFLVANHGVASVPVTLKAISVGATITATDTNNNTINGNDSSIQVYPAPNASTPSGSIGLKGTVWHRLTDNSLPQPVGAPGANWAYAHVPNYTFTNSRVSSTLALSYNGSDTTDTNTFLGSDAAGAAATDTNQLMTTYIDYTGYLHVTTNGNYTFTPGNVDDFALMFLGGGTAPGITTTVMAAGVASYLFPLPFPSPLVLYLPAAGYYPIEIFYVNQTYNGGTGGANLNYSISGPGTITLLTGSTIGFRAYADLDTESSDDRNMLRPAPQSPRVTMEDPELIAWIPQVSEPVRTAKPSTVFPYLPSQDSRFDLAFWSDGAVYRHEIVSSHILGTSSPDKAVFVKGTHAYTHFSTFWLLNAIRKSENTLVGLYRRADRETDAGDTNTISYTSGTALSVDDGRTWEDQGAIIGRGGMPDAADFDAEVTCMVFDPNRSRWLGIGHGLGYMSLDPNAAPGTWYGWHEGRFDQPEPDTIGSNLEEPLPGLSADMDECKLHYNMYLQLFVLLWRPWDGHAIMQSYSHDGINWAAPTELMRSTKNQMLSNAEIIGVSDVAHGKRAYLYYQQRASEPPGKAALMRRPIQFTAKQQEN